MEFTLTLVVALFWRTSDILPWFTLGTFHLSFTFLQYLLILENILGDFKYARDIFSNLTSRLYHASIYGIINFYYALAHL